MKKLLSKNSIGSLGLGILVAGISGCNSGGGSSSTSPSLNGGDATSSQRDERPACFSASASVVGLSDTAIQCSGNASVQGSVVLMGASTLTLSGNASVSDRVYTHSSDSVTEHGHPTVGSIVLDDLTDREPAVMDFVDRLSTLTETQSFDSISGPTTIVGNGGLNVIHVANGISLAASDALLLSGGAQDNFVIVVEKGGIRLSGNASIVAGADVSARRILFLAQGTDGFSLTGNGSAVGTFFAPNGPAQVSGNGHIVGAFVASGNVLLSGNGLTFTPAAWCPELDDPTPSPSPSATPTPSPSSTSTPSPSPSPTDSGTPSPSPSPSDTSTPSPSPSPSDSPSPSPTPTGIGVIGV